MDVLGGPGDRRSGGLNPALELAERKEVVMRDAYRYCSLEALRAEFEDDLPRSQGEGVIRSLPMTGVGAVGGRLRALAGGPDAL